MRLEARVTVWLLVLFGAAAAVALIGITRLQNRSLERQFQDAGRVLALAVENSLEVSMLNNAPDDIRQAVRDVQRGTLIKSVSVYRRDGAVWVSSHNGGQPARPAPKALLDAMTRRSTTTAPGNGDLTQFVPVANQPRCARCHPGNSQVLGAVGVTLDEQPLLSDLAQNTRASLSVAAVPLFLGVLASLWAVRRGLLRPLAMLGTASKRVAHGDLTVRLPLFKAPELGSVSKTFNEMTSRLQRQSADLHQTVDELRSDLEGMEEIQSLLASGAGLGEVLSGAAEHLASALGAAGVGIWRLGSDGPGATSGDRLPPRDKIGLASGGKVQTSEGILADVRDDVEIGWVVAPAMRGGRPFAVVGVVWDPPRPLAGAERDLLASLTGVVAVAVENTDLLERLGEKEKSLEGLLKKTLAAQEEERRRVARELHDETSQILSALMMNIELLESQIPQSKTSRVRLEAVKALAEEAARNLDKVLIDLRPALLDELGLAAALRWYVSQVREVWGLPVELETAGTKRLPQHVEVAAFRIAQEAIANAVKYSKASRVLVRVGSSNEGVSIEVSDDGVGFDVSAAAARARTGEAAGLVGMRERAELLGGRLSVESRPGAGTNVRAEIPLAEG